MGACVHPQCWRDESLSSRIATYVGRNVWMRISKPSTDDVMYTTPVLAKAGLQDSMRLMVWNSGLMNGSARGKQGKVGVFELGGVKKAEVYVDQSPWTAGSTRTYPFMVVGFELRSDWSVEQKVYSQCMDDSCLSS